MIALGAFLRHRDFFKETFFREINRLVYWVGLPCLLFVKTAQNQLQLGPAMEICLVLFAGMVICLGLGYLTGWLFHLPSPSMAAYVQGAFRGNLVYVGLSVILFSMTETNGQAAAEFEALAVLAVAPLIPIYNIVAVFVLLAGRPRKGKQQESVYRQLWINIATNPLILPCLAGIGYASTGWKLPPIIFRSCSLIGQIALPMALISMGASLSPRALRGNLLSSISASMIKVFIAPLSGLALAVYFDFSPQAIRLVLIYMATPTAVAGYVMAEQLEVDHVLTGNIILISTLMAMPVLTCILTVT